MEDIIACNNIFTGLSREIKENAWAGKMEDIYKRESSWPVIAIAKPSRSGVRGELVLSLQICTKKGDLYPC